MLKAIMLAAYLTGQPQDTLGEHAVFSVSSPAFREMGIIPKQYTCKGDRVSFPLEWKHVPPHTQSLALIVIDRDVPQHALYHWALYNIPPTTESLSSNARIEPPIETAKNSWNNKNYEPPCPPTGVHHYTARLYALDKTFSDTDLATLILREQMRDHILGTAEITGRVSAH